MLKNSARAAEAIQVLKEEGYRINEIANELHVSRQHIGNISNGKRNMPQDIAQESLHRFENGVFALAVLNEFSDNQTPPALQGRCLDHHRMSLLSLLGKESDDVETQKDSIIQVISKPPETLNRNEIEEVERFLLEIVDLYAITANTLANMSSNYKFSVKKLFKKRMPTWKLWGWL